MTTKTIASLGLALILTATIATGAQARTRQQHETTFDRHSPNGYSPGTAIALKTYTRRSRGKTIRRYKERSYIAAKAKPRTLSGYGRHIAKSASLDHVTPKLAAKAREIVSACGAKVISAYRPGARVRGYGTPSLHSRYPAQAVDMTGNTSCIYPRLKGWPGGYSVDYAAVQHVHISLASDRRERGARFAHYGTRRYARR